MFNRIRILTITAALVAFLTGLTGPAGAAVYAWKGDNGVMTFSDDPTKAPPGVKVEVRDYGTGTATQTASERSPNAVTQGEFALQLAIELGLAKQGLGAEQAAQTLARLHIAPPLGRWDLDQPLTKELLQRLRKLTAAAAVGGTIALTPQEALYAFDTAADLVGVAIRERPVPEAQPGSVPVTAEQVPTTVYVVPSAPSTVEERVIFVGGCCTDGLLVPGQIPIVVNKKIINVQKVIINRQVPPRPAPPPTHVTVVPALRPAYPPARFVPTAGTIQVGSDVLAGTVPSASGMARTIPTVGFTAPGIVTPLMTQAPGGMRARATR
jgi:hypothetical protein